ncbi:MAG: DUF4326 domain-containing protein [Trueperaceae bacterium]|nr:DUF4326 domain-containing protein [Trueperaceae bacterium]
MPKSKSNRPVLPPDAVVIDRRTRWGNPFTLNEYSREEAIARFREYAEARLLIEPDWLAPLRGQRLACWCAPLACHGQVLAEIESRSHD